MAGQVSRPAHQSSTVAVIDKLDILMRPETHQAQSAGAGLLVDQHQVRLHVAVAVSGPLAA